MTQSGKHGLWSRVLGTLGGRLDGLGSRLWACTGIFIRDDGSGTISGVASSGMDAVPLVFRHFTQLVCGEASGNFTTGSSTFGSFADAVTDLDDWDSLSGTWDIHYPIEDAMTPDDMAADLSSQAPVAIYKSIWDGKWKMPVYPTGTPGTHKYFLDPTGAAYKWKVGEDFIADSVQVGYTPVDEIVNEVHVRFGLFPPTGQYRYETYVSPTDSDDGNYTGATRDQNAAAPNNRETYALDSKTDYGVKSALTLDMPTTTNYLVAVKMRNYLFDRLFRPRITVTFTTHARAIGIEPGMVTLIHNDLQNYIPVPWYPGPRASAHVEWDDIKFFVRNVGFDYSGGAFLHTVSLEEIPT